MHIQASVFLYVSHSDLQVFTSCTVSVKQTQRDKAKSQQTDRDEGSQCSSGVCPAELWLMCESPTLSGCSLITCSVFTSQSHTRIVIAALHPCSHNAH